MHKLNKIKVGLVATSMPHFPVEEAKKSMDKVSKVLPISKDNLVGPYLVTTPEDSEKVTQEFKTKDIDALIILEGAFTWDNIPARIVQDLGDIPVIMWAFPEPPMKGGKLLTNSLCGAIMNCAALKKLGRKYRLIYGNPEEKKTITILDQYLRAIAAVKRLSHSKYCLIGYRTPGFYNSTFDEMLVRKTFGIETVHLSLLDLMDYALQIKDKTVQKDVNMVKGKWKIGEATEKDLYNSAKFHKFLVDFSRSNKIDCYGIKCWPELPKRGLNICFVIGWLTDEGIISGCEADFDGTMTMLLQYYLTDEIPWLADLIHMDEKKNVCIFWHCGAAPPSLASDKSGVAIQKQYRGLDRGASIEFPLQAGRVTIARLGPSEGRYRMFITTGEAIQTEMILRGNPSIVKMDSSVEDMLGTISQNGIEHHYAIIYGDHKNDLVEVCQWLNIKIIMC